MEQILISDDFLQPKLFKLNKFCDKDILCKAHIFHIFQTKNEILEYNDVMKLLEHNQQIICTDYAYNQIISKKIIF